MRDEFYAESSRGRVGAPKECVRLEKHGHPLVIIDATFVIGDLATL